MLLYAQPPKNHDDPSRRYNAFSGSGHARSEFGIGVNLARMCEYVITRSTSKINVLFEAVEATWVCVDYVVPNDERRIGKGLTVSFEIRFLTVYPPERGGGDRLNDFFQHWQSIFAPEKCAFYTDDRPEFARRLMLKLHQAWGDSWNLRQQVEEPPRPRPKWPVRAWVHGEPGRVWEIGDGDSRTLKADHPPVDERLIELYLQ